MHRRWRSSSPACTPGSDSDARSAIWLVEHLKQLGLQPHINTFTGVVDGRSVALQNVWAASPGKTRGDIVVLANRDSPPLDSQGADDNASGVATVLESARIFTLSTHAHELVFLWTDGDAYGNLGANAFVARYADLPMIGALALRRVGRADLTRVSLDGWSASPRVAPPWTGPHLGPQKSTVGDLPAHLPHAFVQMLRLAAPVGIPAARHPSSRPACRRLDARA